MPYFHLIQGLCFRIGPCDPDETEDILLAADGYKAIVASAKAAGFVTESTRDIDDGALAIAMGVSLSKDGHTYQGKTICCAQADPTVADRLEPLGQQLGQFLMAAGFADQTSVHRGIILSQFD